MTGAGGFKSSGFKPSGKNYFADLLAFGSDKGLFDQKDEIRIAESLSYLAADRAEKLVDGKTSSLKKEAVCKLAESVAFTIGISLKARGGIAEGLSALKEIDIKDLFFDGLKKIECKTLAARLAHEKLKRNLIKTENYYYNATVKPALDGFFKLYTPGFFAQDIHITADYPVFFGVSDLAGIEFIEKYIADVSAENEFLAKFPCETVDAILCGIDKNYKLTPINLYEPIFIAALCAELSFGSITELKYDFRRAESFFFNAEKEEVEKSLFAAAEKVITVLGVSRKLAEYAKRSVPRVSATVKIAADLNCLKHVLPAFRMAK